MPSVLIQQGNVYGPFQIYQKDNIYVVLSDIPLFSESAYSFVQNSIEYGMIKAINGGFENKATISSNITIDAADNMMVCGPASFTGTVVINGTLTIV